MTEVDLKLFIVISVMILLMSLAFIIFYKVLKSYKSGDPMIART